jgi:predicted CxxxxCH...CXXCH cytochrome family protein
MRCALSVTSRVLPLLALAAGCGVLRPTDFQPVCPDYDKQVQPVLDAQCSGCHPAGAAYSTTSYTSVLKPSADDLQRFIPGDASSPFMQAVRGELLEHSALSSDDQALLTTWVVTCRGGHRQTLYHPAGWANPLNGSEFHGAVARDGGYTFSECISCHGADLRGGKAGVDCNSCHTQDKGPLACNTCHGDELSPAPPKALNGSYARATLGVGAHQKHVNDGPLHKAFACESCHPHVENAQDDGHFRFNGVFLAQGPVVTLPASDAGVPPQWNVSDATCSQSACHAPNANDTAATGIKPVWTRIDGTDGKCGTCHGRPPSSHKFDNCVGCHGPGYADGGVDLALHVNGKVDLVAGTDCGVCHGAPNSGADWFDTHGSRDAGAPGVGAHAAHLTTDLRGPIACNECHIVPKTVFDPGHIDTPPAKVFPAGWDGGAAALDGVVPSFDSTALTCNVYCHGTGELLTSRDHANVIRAPVWNLGESQEQCGGACHGAPPQDGNVGHQVVATSIQACVMCHALTVNPDGTIRTFTQSDGGIGSFHMNGEINGNL